MKSPLTALTACAAMGLTTANIFAIGFTWDGGANTDKWDKGTAPLFADNNWAGGNGWPGRSGATDTALLNTGGANNQYTVVFSNSGVTATIAAATVDANANAAPMVMKVTSGSLTVSGLTRIVAEKSSDVDAKLWVNAGTFVPTTLELEGDVNDGGANDASAVADFDVSVTVAGQSGTDTTIEGLADVHIGNATFNAKDLEMIADADLLVVGDHANAMFLMTSMDLEAGTGTNDYRPVSFQAAGGSQLVIEID